MIIRSTERLLYENMFRRQMLAILSPAETKVMVFIMDRTLGWQRVQARITIRDIVSGVGNNAGAGVTKTTAARCIDSLADKKVIIVREVCRKLGTLIEINIQWEPESSMLRTPKRLKSQPQNGEESDGKVHQMGHWCPTTWDTGVLPSGTHLIEDNNRTEIKDSVAGGTGAQLAVRKERRLQPVAKPSFPVADYAEPPIATPDTPPVLDTIAAVKAKAEASRIRREENRRAKLDAGIVTVPMIESAWREAATEAGYVVKVWTVKEKGQAKHLQKALAIQPDRLLELVGFVAGNWQRIIAKQFDWAGSELHSDPSIGFFLKYAERFVYAFRNKDLILASGVKGVAQFIKQRALEQGVDENELEQDIETRLTRTGRKRIGGQESKKAQPVEREADSLRRFHESVRRRAATPAPAAPQRESSTVARRAPAPRGVFVRETATPPAEPPLSLGLDVLNTFSLPDWEE
ncbi:hypothetical protein H10PHJ05_70 [Aeromonas phage HJ05]|nr:hypothetical protein H10PHJ05_70 [Aeromonas phage HJ05]